MVILIRNLEWYTAIAAYLPELTLTPNTRKHSAAATAGDPYLHHPNGWQRVPLRRAWSERWNRARFIVSPQPGRAATNQIFYAPEPTITVDALRPGHKIAGEITRRLIPQANAWIEQYHTWRADWDARQRLTTDILQMLVNVGHGSPSSTAHQSPAAPMATSPGRPPSTPATTLST
ncbi:MAG: hypothetical protein R3C14_40500 [Caldilineaceae bacterium]